MNNTEQILRDQINFWLHKNYKYFKGQTKFVLKPFRYNGSDEFEFSCNLHLEFGPDLTAPDTIEDMTELIKKVNEALTLNIDNVFIKYRFFNIWGRKYVFKDNDPNPQINARRIGKMRV